MLISGVLLELFAALIKRDIYEKQTTEKRRFDDEIANSGLIRTGHSIVDTQHPRSAC